MATSALRIRPAERDELGAVLALWARAGLEPSATDSLDKLELLTAQDPDTLLVAEIDSALVGTVIAAWDGWRANLYRLAVDPDHRRQGLASALVQEAERRLTSRGARRVSALVLGDIDEATRFWRALGYEPQTRTRRLVRHLGVPHDG